MYGDVPLVHPDGLDLEVDAEGGAEVGQEDALRDAVDEAGLAHGGVAGEDHLEIKMRKCKSDFEERSERKGREKEKKERERERKTERRKKATQKRET